MLVKEMIYPCGTRVLAWWLEESSTRLLQLCRERGIAIDDLTALPDKRQREQAAERLLLCQAFGRPVVMGHTGQGAPYVDGLDVNISISHTPRLVALAVDDHQTVGLDAEQMDRRQVLRVRDKFLNAAEQQFITPDDLAAHIIAWTAKEAIIKAERNSALDWTDGISLEPFAAIAPLPEEILLAARCGDCRYRLVTRCVEGHYLTLAYHP